MAPEPRGGTLPTPDLSYEIRDGIGWIVFDRPDAPVNLLTRDTMGGLEDILRTAGAGAESGELRALVIRSHKPDNFIAGADIDELAAVSDREEAARLSREGQAILNRLERLPVPTLAAINGTCVGGGLELVLTCDHRVAKRGPKTRLGLPETRLGILPGLGGTVRLPRLIGLRRALDLILSGKQIDVDRARAIGLVDQVIEADAFDTRVEAIAEMLARGESPLPAGGASLLTRMLENHPPLRWIIARMARARVFERTRGNYPAQPKALDVTVSGLGRSLDRALEAEARGFAELAVTPESKNLIRVFRLTQGAKKRRPEGEARRELRRAGVIGAGVMGAGIAELFAYQDLPVRLVDVSDEQLRAGMERIRSLLKKAGRRAGWSDEELRERIDRVTGSTEYEGFESVDFVIEAVVERIDVKRQVFSALEQRVPPDAVIATNTSALPVTELQRELRHPERVCGLHFFNPPHRMPLVEVVRGGATGSHALAAAFDVATTLGKTPVVVADSPGFVVNRILATYLIEAGHLLAQGIDPEQLDEAMLEFGMPMGPLRLLDEIGLDIVADVNETLVDGLGERFAPAPLMERVLETGVTGRKGGRGFYRYRDGEPEELDPEIAAIVEQHAGGPPPPPEIARERMVLVMINEAARTLDDGVVGDADDIDVAMIMGTGFPPFRGGLLRHADTLGLAHVRERLQHYTAGLGPRFEPAPGLLDCESFFASGPEVSG